MLQPVKAELPIPDTDSGIVTEVRPEHNPKALFPIFFTVFGILIEVILEQL